MPTTATTLSCTNCCAPATAVAAVDPMSLVTTSILAPSTPPLSFICLMAKPIAFFAPIADVALVPVSETARPSLIVFPDPALGAGVRRHPSPQRRVREDRQARPRSGQHTSELQSHRDLVCRLLLPKKKARL